MIELSIDRGRCLITARFSGLLSVNDIEGFASQEADAVGALGVSSDEYDLLIIAADQTVQTQAVVQAVQTSHTRSELKARRIAVVSTGALATIQSQRVSKSRSASRVFHSVSDADAWLREPV